MPSNPNDFEVELQQLETDLEKDLCSFERRYAFSALEGATVEDDYSEESVV